MSERFEKAVSAVIGASALAVALVVIAREARRPDAASASVPPGRLTSPVRIADWDSVLAVGIHTGPEAAPMTVVEFGDFECPYCRQFHGAVKSAIAARPGMIRFVYVHLPLPMHRFAAPAARASECAEARGRFLEFADVVFAKQDSLGMKSWESYAREAKIPEPAAIEACALDSRSTLRVDEGLRIAKKLGISSTPTVVVNGWQLPMPPGESQVVEMLDRIQKGLPPGPPSRR
jgi:protein-disulfide isomerase